MDVEPLQLDLDWDWLIILDACRYDYFARLWKKSKVEPRLSPASCTLGFLDWLPKIDNSVVITGHPFVINNQKIIESRLGQLNEIIISSEINNQKIIERSSMLFTVFIAFLIRINNQKIIESVY